MDSPIGTTLLHHVSSPPVRYGSNTAKFSVRSAKTLISISSPGPLKDLKGICSSFEEARLEDVYGECNKHIQEAPAPSTSLTSFKDGDSFGKMTAAVQDRDKFAEQANLSDSSERTFARSKGHPGGQGPSASLTRTRGRSEWRKLNMSNRSKSLDWRGAGNENTEAGRPGVLGDDIVDTSRRSESLERKGSMERRAMQKAEIHLNSVSSFVKVYNAVDHSDQLSNNSLSSTYGMGRAGFALMRARGGQSLPTRFKPRLSQGNIEDRDSLWFHLSQDDSSPQHTRPKMEFWTRDQGTVGAKADEVTGNQSILDRIERLYGSTASDASCTTNTKELNQVKRHSAPIADWSFMDSKGMSSSPESRRSSTDITLGSPSPYVRQWRRVSVDKGGTFPRMLSKGGGITLLQGNTSPTTNENERKGGLYTLTPPVSVWSRDNPGRQEPGQPLISEHNKSDDSTQQEGTVENITRSLDRARSRVSATKLLSPFRMPATCSAETFTKDPSHSNFFESNGEGKGKETGWDRQNTVTDSGKQTVESAVGLAKDLNGDMTTEPKIRNRLKISKGTQTNEDMVEVNKADIRSESHVEKYAKNSDMKVSKYSKGNIESTHNWTGITTFKHQTPSTITAERENLKDDNDVFDTEQSKTPAKTQRCLLGKQVSLDSVRNTIHMFEALAQKTKTPTQFQHSRRAYSVPEQIKPMAVEKMSEFGNEIAGVSGTGAERSYRGALVDQMGSNSMGLSTTLMRFTGRSFSVDEMGLTHDAQDRESFRRGHGALQALKHGDETKFNQGILTDKNRDEPDNSKPISLGIKRQQSVEEKVKNYLITNFPVSQLQNCNNISNHSSTPAQEFCHSKSDIHCSDDEDITPTGSLEMPPFAVTLSPNPDQSRTSTQARAFLISENSPESILCTPKGTQPVSSNSSLTENDRDVRPTISVQTARWSSDEEDDEEDEDSNYDSDSADSSVTITSKTSQGHRSFSVSLADLCYFGGVEYGEGVGLEDEQDDWTSRRTASVSSDVSALSSVTLMDTEELDRLLDDVRGLGNDTLQNYDEVKVVVLHKDVGSGLGFTLAGGVDQNKPITVHKVFPSGAAAQEGSIQEGDLVLSINGTKLQSSGHWEAVRTLRKTRGRGMAVVVLKGGAVNGPQPSRRDIRKKGPGAETGRTGNQITVTLEKSSTDLGFSLQGGVASNLVEKPITVQRVFQGGPFGLVFPGDELLEIQGQSLGGLRRLEAWNLIKSLPPGAVKVVLRRPYQPR